MKVECEFEWRPLTRIVASVSFVLSSCSSIEENNELEV
jgi:hypothetical protein